MTDLVTLLARANLDWELPHRRELELPFGGYEGASAADALEAMVAAFAGLVPDLPLRSPAAGRKTEPAIASAWAATPFLLNARGQGFVLASDSSTREVQGEAPHGGPETYFLSVTDTRVCFLGLPDVRLTVDHLLHEERLWSEAKAKVPASLTVRVRTDLAYAELSARLEPLVKAIQKLGLFETAFDDGPETEKLATALLSTGDGEGAAAVRARAKWRTEFYASLQH